MQSARSSRPALGVAPGLLLKMLPRPRGPPEGSLCAQDPSQAWPTHLPGCGWGQQAAASLPGSPAGAAGHPPWSLGLLMPWACSWGPLPRSLCLQPPPLPPHPAGLIVPSPRPRHPHSTSLFAPLFSRLTPTPARITPTLCHSLSVHLPDDVVSIQSTWLTPHPANWGRPCRADQAHKPVGTDRGDPGGHRSPQAQAKSGSGVVKVK